MKRIHAYSLSAAACLAGTGAAQGQILYTDIDPDLVCDLDRVFFDLDQDGTDDVWVDRFYSGFFGVQYSSIAAGNANPYAAIASMGAGFPGDPIRPFLPGEAIGSSASWVNPHPVFGGLMAGLSFIGYSSCEDPTVILGNNGDFYDATNVHLGVRLTKPEGNVYGWIRLSVEYQDPCPLPYHDAFVVTAYDMALQLTPDTPIAAGDLGGCTAPVGLVSIAAATEAKCMWDPVAGAELYKLQYRAAGAIDWQTKTVYSPKTARIIKGLTCGTSYEWRLAAVCDGVPSDFSETLTFTTGVCRTDNASYSEPLEVFPNPATDLVNIQVPEAGSLVHCRILTLSGTAVISTYSTDNEIITIDVAALPAGMYLIEVVTTQQTYLQSLVCQ